MELSPSELKVIEDLQNANQNLKAYKAAEKFGDLRHWQGPEAILAASHLSYSLGAPEQSYRLAARAWHKYKEHPKAIFYYAIELMQKRGPLPALIFTRRYPDFAADDKLMSWWYSLLAEIHSSLRDFTASDRWHAKAEEICPEEPWVWTARSYSLEQQDKYEQALEAAYRGLELNPIRRAGVSSVAHFLTLLERDDEAIRLLESTVDKVENAWLLKHLSEIQTELGMHREAFDTLQRCFELLPLMEEKIGEWLYGSLSDLSYLLNDRSASVDYASKTTSEFYKKIVENLKEAPADAKRKVIDVGFLRQHHVTCAPATISNLARYWKKDVAHLDIVDQICYDGTPSYKERFWAETNGWKTREFTLNWDDAVSFLDAGVPLTLATVHPGGGHLQAIIGYDQARGTYLLRDPYYRRTGEVLAKELLEDQQANGPRVMAMGPKGWNDELFDQDWSEAAIYDLNFKLDSALEGHRRDEAEEAINGLNAEFPGHRLNNVAHWSAAGYDSNTPGIRAALQELLSKYPDDVNLRVSDLSISTEFITRTERMDKLERYATAKKSDPLIWQMFGYELGSDAKQHRRALKWLFRSLRRSPGDGLSYRFLADILWSQRRFEEATELYRFAFSINDKDEHFAFAYFLAMRFLKREEEALAILTERAKLFTKQSRNPVISLFSALRELGRVSDAFEALDRGLETLPTDGDLKLYAAEMRARYGQFDRAAELLSAAEPASSKTRWLRASAFIAQLRGDLASALSDWRKISAIDPSALDAHENIAFLTKGSEGELAAKDYLRRVCRKFPNNRSLQVLRLRYLNEESTEAIAVLRDLVRSDPGDAWAMRELSHWYLEVGRDDDALQIAEQAVTVDPNESSSHWFCGRSLEELKRFSEAAGFYKRSVGLNVDNVFAIRSWVGVLRDVRSKREALEYIWSELNKQTTLGEGLFSYREEARRVLDRVMLLNQLREFAAANPGSWFAASVLIQQLAEMGKAEEALSAATEATARFPLIRDLWMDLALVHRLTGRSDEAIKALHTTVSVDPVWSFGIQQLADAYQLAGRFAESRDVLLEGLTRLPFDHYLLGYLADSYWGLGEKEKAIETAGRAVTLDPDYAWAWGAIKRWAEQTGDGDLPIDLARDLTVRKPKDVRSWTNLAEMLDNGVYSEDRMSVIEKALEIEPHNVNALALKANALSDGRRFDEAIEVTKTRSADGHRPEQLRYVEAGIEMMRSRPSRCVDILVELTESSPGYLPGWSRLADFYRTDPERGHEYRKVAMEIVRLAPRDAVGFGYLAEACLQLELRSEAKDALRQAVILDPAYSYAVNTLFDMYLEDGDDSEAAELVESVVAASPSNGLPIAVELAVKVKDKQLILDRLEQFLREPNIDRGRAGRVFERAFQFFSKKDQTLLEMVGSVVAAGGANELSGRFLVDVADRTENLKTIQKRLESLESQPKIWSFAASRFLELMAISKPTGVVNYIDSKADLLRADTESWASVGYQLTSLSDGRRAEDWYEGWERRKDVMPWMLWNYSLVLRRNGRAEYADKINSAALDLRPDDTINLHLTSLGLRDFAQRNFAEAAAVLSQINGAVLSGWDRFLFDALNEAVIAGDHIAGGDNENARALIESIYAGIVEFDPKGTDRMIRNLVGDVLNVLLDDLGSKWLSLKLKAKLMYHRLG